MIFKRDSFFEKDGVAGTDSDNSVVVVVGLVT